MDVDLDFPPLQNVLDELIVYRHDGGNRKGDTVDLCLSDGDFQEVGTLTVVIGLVNDETPRVSVNRGLRVNSGEKTNPYFGRFLSFWGDFLKTKED